MCVPIQEMPAFVQSMNLTLTHIVGSPASTVMQRLKVCY